MGEYGVRRGVEKTGEETTGRWGIGNGRHARATARQTDRQHNVLRAAVSPFPRLSLALPHPYSGSPAVMHPLSLIPTVRSESGAIRSKSVRY